jgi:hypothetical protein
MGALHALALAEERLLVLGGIRLQHLEALVALRAELSQLVGVMFTDAGYLLVHTGGGFLHRCVCRCVIGEGLLGLFTGNTCYHCSLNSCHNALFVFKVIV